MEKKNIFGKRKNNKRLQSSLVFDYEKKKNHLFEI